MSICNVNWLIDTARNNTTVKLTMRYSTDALVLTNGNLLIEKTFFSLRYFNIKLSLKFLWYLARELKLIRNFSDHSWVWNANFIYVEAAK